MLSVRATAGDLIGMGYVSKSVTPKFGLLAPARDGGTIATRYFMPWKTHPTMAVTGAQCLAAGARAPGTCAEGLGRRRNGSPATCTREPPLGSRDVRVQFESGGDGFRFVSAGGTRTARLLARGGVMVPRDVWNGQAT